MDRNPDSHWNPAEPVTLTPVEFEQQVLSWLRGSAEGLSAFEAEHQGIAVGAGGEYSIDILAAFSILNGARVVIMVECKHQKRPVERDEVILLEGKLRDVGAHKGMFFSTSGFQMGAVKYAGARGIATITVVEGRGVALRN